ncbi:arfaptin-2 [Manacus vitellinus]|uniref:arfaptin-2 n=1 Tax=Manacus vitellinus TaxID=328815 RepID=UPI00115E2F51|nr:arfaptin-2 [Manacus vitellinus]
MSDGILSKAATMEIPISSNGDTSSLPEDDGLEQDLQQVMVSGPNLNETSIVSGGYGGTAEGIIPTGTIKGTGDRLSRGLLQGRVCSSALTVPSSGTKLCCGRSAEAPPGGLHPRWAQALCRGTVWGLCC